MTMMNQTTFTHDVPIDADVFTRDHDKLGTVKEIRNGCFKVDVPMQPDYWLPLSCVSTMTGTEVVLTFTKDHLDDSKLSSPIAA
jgi:hypothetical protein